MFTPHGTFSLAQFIPPLIVLILGLAFWAWMFRDMMDNIDLPPGAKENWTVAFIFLNVFAAMLYYANIYKDRRRR